MKATITLLILAVVFTFNTKCQEMNRDASTDLLKIVVEGGTQGFADEAYIHFHKDATTGYDIEIDAVKWWSPDPEATMIWTVASDYTNLAINNLPQEDLYGILNTIPMQFVCGYDGGEYQLTFSEIDTFDESVEIWIEDLLSGEGWISITAEEDTYTFSALPEDTPDRFKIHILDPAAITGTEVVNTNVETIKIYANDHTVFIQHPEKSEITNFQVFNIKGQNVQHTVHYESQLLMKSRVDGPSGYYIVRLMANKHVYTQKVFVKKF